MRRAHEPALERQALGAQRERAAGPRQRGLDLQRAHVGARAPADPHAARAHARRQARARRVVDVHDRHRVGLPARGQLVEEEPRLGGGVALEVAVEVEVIPGQVGEHGGVEAAARDALLGERVGGDLQRDVRGARGAHLGEQRLERDRVGGGERSRPARPVEAIGDGSHHARAPSRRAPDRLQQVGGGRLAVGPGHTDERERGARVAREVSGGAGEEAVRRVQANHRGASGVHLARRDHRAGPASERLGDVPPAIGVDARQREEHVARPDLARVGRDAADLHVLPHPARLHAQRPQELAQPHRAVFMVRPSPDPA